MGKWPQVFTISLCPGTIWHMGGHLTDAWSFARQDFHRAHLTWYGNSMRWPVYFPPSIKVLHGNFFSKSHCARYRDCVLPSILQQRLLGNMGVDHWGIKSSSSRRSYWTELQSEWTWNVTEKEKWPWYLWITVCEWIGIPPFSVKRSCFNHICGLGAVNNGHDNPSILRAAQQN